MADTTTYRVTATALNLRASPSSGAAILAVMPSDSIVAAVADCDTAGWLNVAYNGAQGFASSQWLEPQSAGPSTAASPPAPDDIVPAPPNGERDQDLSKLHPLVRQAITATVAELNQAGAPFQVFEAFRTPERQAYLYAQGRTRPGGIVTNAQAWQSYHQYGLAADLVLFRDGAWSWSTAGADAALWTQLHTVGESHGLRPLSFEAPHLEFAGPDWRDLEQGNGFPPGGDDTWYDAVSGAAARWTAAGGAPPTPPLTPGERPPLPAVDPLAAPD